MDENVKNEVNDEDRPRKPLGAHKWCEKCKRWIITEVFNNMHQVDCGFYKKKPAPHVPKVLETDADWKAYLASEIEFLKEWQVTAIIYILKHFADPAKKPGFILADEMGMPFVFACLLPSLTCCTSTVLTTGLGKTLTAIMVMKALHASESLRMTYPEKSGRINHWTSGIFLVVAPLSTLHSVWRHQLRKYGGKGVVVFIYHGHGREGDLQKCLKAYAGGSEELVAMRTGKGPRGPWDPSKMLVVVSTYATMAADCGVCKNKAAPKGQGGSNPVIRDLPFTLCVFDEAHLAKGGPEEPPMST